MNKERAITYSLLAHIRNTGTLVKGPIDIFIPLIKRVLSKMNLEGVFKGKNISEIKTVAENLYHIDFPIPVLKKILKEICNEINTDEKTHFIIYKDGAFSIDQYSFLDYDQVINSQVKDIDELEKLFKEFCNTSKLSIDDSGSIFKFIEKNKYNLSKYISNNHSDNGDDYSAEAQFVDFFKKIPQVYDRIKNIYIGSIIAGYIEYNPDGVDREIELLLDTNFLVGLIDLNTPESTHTCRTLLDIAKQQNFKINVLKDTIDETTNLLETKARYFDKTFLQRKVNPEDIYNACDRLNLNKSDLERIADNLESLINEFGIAIIPHTEKLKNEAKYTNEYKTYKKIRHTDRSALHDATTVVYIKKKRTKRIKDFDKVNAWFVNNSASVEGENIFSNNGYQPEIIKADDLLNILWLSNPQVNKSIGTEDLANIGLTSTISLTLNKNLPKSSILRELDDNIHKYAKESISDADIIRVATRITNKQLKNIEELNQIAGSDKAEFVRRLSAEANKQKRIEENRIKSLEKKYSEFSLRADEFAKQRSEHKSKSFVVMEKRIKEEKKSLQKELLNEKNAHRKIKYKVWEETQLKKWRQKTWFEFVLPLFLFSMGIVYILYKSNWDLTQGTELFTQLKGNIIFSSCFSILLFIFTGVTFRTLLGKYRNHSNIQNYIKGLDVPDELKQLQE